jgi:hypothetical protein
MMLARLLRRLAPLAPGIKAQVRENNVDQGAMMYRRNFLSGSMAAAISFLHAVGAEAGHSQAHTDLLREIAAAKASEGATRRALSTAEVTYAAEVSRYPGCKRHEQGYLDTYDQLEAARIQLRDLDLYTQELDLFQRERIPGLPIPGFKRHGYDRYGRQLDERSFGRELARESLLQTQILIQLAKLHKVRLEQKLRVAEQQYRTACPSRAKAFKELIRLRAEVANIERLKHLEAKMHLLEESRQRPKSR